MTARILAVALDARHDFTKHCCESIKLVAGLGVEGDAHSGATVQHRSRKKQFPDMANLRQLHLIHAELFVELAGQGYAIAPGQLGENITTKGIDLLTLPRGAQLRLGDDALVELTGLRNPCRQIDDNIGPGAMAAMLAREKDGSLIRKSGVMAVILSSGEVRAGDPVELVHRPAANLPLEPV
mgnify:CR=1 FL=1